MQLSLRWCAPACVGYDWSGRVTARGLLAWTRASGSSLCARLSRDYFLFCLFVLFFLAVELVFSDASIFYISCLAAVVFVYVPVLI